MLIDNLDELLKNRNQPKDRKGFYGLAYPVRGARRILK